MSARSFALTKKANLSAASSYGRTRNFLRFGPRVMQTARGIFPNKTAHNLAGITGDPVRTWEYWLSKERLPGEALAALLESEHGLQFLDAIAGQSFWWRAARKALAAVEEREAKMQEAIHAIAQTSTGFRFSDVVGGKARSVVAAKKKTAR